MKSNQEAPVLVVLQLTGGNDYLNSVIPYNDGNYRDSRPALQIPEEAVIKLDDELGLHPAMKPLEGLYKNYDVAIIHGVGFENSPRSHFRSMDIWHTCEPNEVGTQGWLGRVTRELDPTGENPITCVNVGFGLPRALIASGVPVASVSDLDTYGLLTNFQQNQLREDMLNRFARMYSPAIGTGPAMEHVSQTGLVALEGADILKGAPQHYASTVEYADNPIGNRLKDIAKIHIADLGTRIFYTQHGSFDTHAAQAPAHNKLWAEVSMAVSDFWEDLREHNADQNVIMFLFSEFGRRVRDNGSGTDHGSAGAAFAIGSKIKGGMYGEYPDTAAQALDQGDLVPNIDFRGVYSSILEQWLELDATPIVNGRFEQLDFIGSN